MWRPRFHGVAQLEQAEDLAAPTRFFALPKAVPKSYFPE
jgi:hypothetical protein